MSNEILGVIIDTETGGFSSQYNALLEIGAVSFKKENGVLVPVTEFFTGVIPPSHLSIAPQALEVNRIPFETIYSPLRGVEEEEAYSKFIEWYRPEFSSAPETYAHNSNFDSNFLVELSRRVNGDRGLILSPERWNCTKQLASQLFASKKLKGKKVTSLSGLCEYFSIPTNRDRDGHSALVDCHLTLKVLSELWKVAGWLESEPQIPSYFRDEDECILDGPKGTKGL